MAAETIDTVDYFYVPAFGYLPAALLIGLLRANPESTVKDLEQALIEVYHAGLDPSLIEYRIKPTEEEREKLRSLAAEVHGRGRKKLSRK
jgi:hypothetical protein